MILGGGRLKAKHDAELAFRLRVIGKREIENPQFPVRREAFGMDFDGASKDAICFCLSKED